MPEEIEQPTEIPAPEVKEEKKSKEQIKHDQIKQAKDEGKRALDTMKKALIGYEDVRSDCYTEMDSYVEMIAEGIGYGTIIEGKGGTGKSFRVVGKLNNKNPDMYVYTDSFTTPQAFYIWLYQNRNKVLVIDDVAGLMSNDKILAMLKGGLWDVDGERIINYMTTKPIKDEYDIPIPTSFEFDGRMIIITNKLNQKSGHVQAVLSRVNHCRLDIPYKELIGIMEQIAKQPFETLKESERLEVLDFLKENTSQSNRELNLRTLIKMFQFKIFANKVKKKDLWKVLAKKVLKKDDDLLIIEKLLNDTSFSTENDRIKAFEELTDKGRSTYFDLKKKFFSKQKESEQITEEGTETQEE